MDEQNLNTGTYIITPTNSNLTVTLSQAAGLNSKAIIKNDSDKAVFCVAAKDSVPTAVFPTSSSVPIAGKVILPGATETYSLNEGDKYISVIQKTSGGVGDMYISVGEKS